MNNLHPIMAAALAPFAPRIKPVEEFFYMMGGVLLRCELDYEAASPSSEFEPGHPETAELQKAFIGGIDISRLLSEEQIAEIEKSFLESGNETTI